MLTLLLLTALLPAQTGRFGLPACHGELYDQSGFTLCFDRERKAPLWSAYELTPERLAAQAPKRGSFQTDPHLGSASNLDYRHSGFSRGHLAPARDMAFSDAAFASSFLLSNAAPQHPALNMGKWRSLENTVRRLALDADAVYVITGVLFRGSQTIGNGVAVPSHFYKAFLVVQGSQKTLYAALLPNTANVPGELDDYYLNARELESLTGLQLFTKAKP